MLREESLRVKVETIKNTNHEGVTETRIEVGGRSYLAYSISVNIGVYTLRDLLLSAKNIGNKYFVGIE